MDPLLSHTQRTETNENCTKAQEQITPSNYKLLFFKKKNTLTHYQSHHRLCTEKVLNTNEFFFLIIFIFLALLKYKKSRCCFLFFFWFWSLSCHLIWCSIHCYARRQHSFIFLNFLVCSVHVHITLYILLFFYNFEFHHPVLFTLIVPPILKKIC